jgi:hypothetical protein
MIIYATKQTFERYKLKLPTELTPPINVIAGAVIEKEKGDRLLEWGAKLFYFDKRKCIQVVNFASKFTLFLVDVKVADLENVGDMIVHYLLELYKDDKQMTVALKKMFEENSVICFAKITDKSAIATLNTTQSRFAYDGYRFYEFIRDGILHTIKINHAVNFTWLFTIKIDGKTEYIYAGEKFREIVLNRYGKFKVINSREVD